MDSSPHYPKHIEGRVLDASQRFPADADEHHRYFQVVCPCGRRHFQIFKSDKNSLRVDCACGLQTIVYDLSCYSAATKLPASETYNLIQIPGSDGPCPIFVMYEYGELDDDQPYNQNDITWCQVWAEQQSGDLYILLDDETA